MALGVPSQLTWRAPLIAAVRSTPFRSFASSSTVGTPQISLAGESALLLRFGTEIAVEVNKRVLKCMSRLDKGRRLDGVKDVIPTYASLLVTFNPLKVSCSQVEQWCQEAVSSTSRAEDLDTAPRVVSIPVCYGGEHGPDIDDAARVAGLESAREVMRVHSSGDYRVYFLGFLGGFPYLGGLPASLAKVPRLQTPRQKLPKGTVGIAGGQTGVYTISTPGGWYCLGRTPMKLFDPAQDPPAMLRAGDLVKFVPSEAEIVEEAEVNKGPPAAPAHPWIQIVSPGPLTTVQDIGRDGYARHGVSRSGAADGLALRTGNALLGNTEGAAGLEVTLGGLKLRCLQACAIALTGADCGTALQRHGEASPTKLHVNEAVMLQQGDEVELGYAKDGMRAYVCVQGGVDVPVVLGSRSTDIRAVLGGFEGRQLRRGDVLGRLLQSDAAGVETRPEGAAHDPLRCGSAAGRTWQLRVLPGPGDPSTAAAQVLEKDLRAFLEAKFNVLPRADRMAVCLAQEGREQARAAAKRAEEYRQIPYGLSEYRPPELIMGEWLHQRPLVGGQQMSEGCVSGTVQLPPDGNPVILLAEHQTTGGYKVMAVVIQADLWKVGQMQPGDSIEFVRTDHDEAVKALRHLHEGTCATPAATSTGAPSTTPGPHGRALAQQSNTTTGPSTTPSAALTGLRTASAPLLAGHRAPSLVRGHAHLASRLSSHIDLNADCGEGFDDANLLQYVTSANVACGGHAGTPESIAETVRLAAERGVSIGAHVSFVDREGFGRRALATPPRELFDQVMWQASALDGLCRGADTRVRYIKPHGALYHTVMAGGAQGEAVREAAQKLQLPLLLMPWSPWATYGEGFAERRYDGEKLRSRDKEGAVIHEPHEAAQQAVMLAGRGNLHSICVHGDSPNAVNVAREVRAALEKDFSLAPFCPPALP